INEFLILAKPQAVKFVELDISQIMKETVDLLSAQAVLHNVQFRTYYEQNLPKVFCESNQMKKVFINIIKNAIEVMPKGGYITVSIQKVSDHKVHISIKDEGTGIPAHKIKKLGEPFYTTKERGTGLGLMVTYKIIEEHKGTIEVESKMGEGTVFHIYLPLI
ncbi:ATP-binding protein, partial [Cytobacillus firmus]